MVQSNLTEQSQGNGQGEASPSSPAPVRRPARRWLVWTGRVLVLLLVAAVAAMTYVIHHAEPILRARVVASLEDRFHSPVELDGLHISLFRGLEVTGSGLRILYLGGLDKTHAGNQPPTLSVKNFEFHTGLWQLFQPTMRVGLVRVDGMRLNIPPKSDRGPLVQQTHKKPGRTIVVDEIVCTDMTLTIETDKPGKQPLVFEIHTVTLHDVGAGKAFPFDAHLVNAKPLGDIHSVGQFGPWVSGDPRETPVEGTYSFTNADMASIKGIAGTLSSTGRYGGTLGQIGVVGTTDIPNFALDVSEHPVDLKTEFNATVDGTSGNTKLNSIRATLLNTVLQVSGLVIRASDMPGAEAGGPPPQGHYIEIAVTSDHARVEDVLRLGAKSNPPLMDGALTLRAHLTIPPGHISVSQKMRIQGAFTIRGATFSNPKWQETVDKLSERASGNPEQANAQDAARVASEMSGTFRLANGMLDISKLNYRMPGAEVALNGKYTLDGKTFDFDGIVRTKATASQMLTGWKSILAMPLDPLFKRSGAGLQIPITIRGTRSQPKLGVNLGKMF